MQIFLILALIIAIIAVIFALQNTIAVTIAFLFWHYNGSLALVLLVALLAGAVIGFLVSLPAILRGKWALRTIRKETAELESNLSDHKQRLESAESKLQAQAVPSQPAETKPKPPDESALNT